MKTITFLFLLIFLAPATQAQNYMITFAGTGAATTVDSVHVQNLTQCTDTAVMDGDVLNLSSTVGIKIFADEGTASLNIFPNPAAGNCTATLEAPANGNTTIEIYDAIGKRIAQTQQFLSKGQHTFNIQGTGSGVVYLLKIQSEKYSCTAKLISANETGGTVTIKEITATPHIPPTGKLKDGKNLVTMLYHTGDQLKFKGYSGIYKTVMVLMPTQDQTVTFNFIPCTDADSNNYAVVQIGAQVWMGENLKTTHYSNGVLIPNVTTDNFTWDNCPYAAYCHYNNDITYVPVYGELYNWEAAADSENICPIGWHVPDSTEVLTLLNYLGGGSIAGGKLKENCSTHWQSPNTGATNESGFTALPGGFRLDGFSSICSNGSWWTSSYYPYGGAYDIIIYDNNILWLDGNPKTYGCSIRCIRD